MGEGERRGEEGRGREERGRGERGKGRGKAERKGKGGMDGEEPILIYLEPLLGFL